jgi:hypothetical protein
MDGSRDDAIAFETAQRYREHSGGDAVDRAVQFGEALGSLPEQIDDQHRPFVADALENFPRATRRRFAGRLGGRPWRIAGRADLAGVQEIPS